MSRYRCVPCRASNGEMGKCINCDFFENKHTSARHFKIKRKFHREDAIISRLNKIMEKLDISMGDDSDPRRHNYWDDETIKILERMNKK